MPPCGCTQQKTSNGSTTWVHEDDTGKVVAVGTEVQAKASQIRADGSGTVKPR